MLGFIERLTGRAVLRASETGLLAGRSRPVGARWKVCILGLLALVASPAAWAVLVINAVEVPTLIGNGQVVACLLYTSDAADE